MRPLADTIRPYICEDYHMPTRQYREDERGAHRTTFDANKKKILKTQNDCGICGKPVDKSIRYPHPMSPCVDHIIPIVRGGHPSDMENLQLAHWTCNRQKADKLLGNRKNLPAGDGLVSNRNLPQSADWKSYTPGGNS